MLKINLKKEINNTRKYFVAAALNNRYMDCVDFDILIDIRI